MSNECAVCYVSDINYLLPSVVSAGGVRKFVSREKADVFIFLVDEESRVEETNRILKPYDIRVFPLDSKVYSGFDREKYNKTHVPPAALGRLFMHTMLPEATKRIVYIDGDTWVQRDPSALIESKIPEGKFAAACDMTTFRQKDGTRRGRDIREYLARLGLTGSKEYFNSGVFATSRKTWEIVANDAYHYFVKNTAACKNQDQSALNAVIGDRRIRLSAKWNFQTPFRQLGLERSLNPIIYHFTEPLKPWSGSYGTWGDLHADYKRAIEPFSVLNLPVKIADQTTINIHGYVSWKKALLRKSPLITKLASMYLGINTYEKSAWL